MQQGLAELRGNEEEGDTNPLQNGNEQRLGKRRDYMGTVRENGGQTSISWNPWKRKPHR